MAARLYEGSEIARARPTGQAGHPRGWLGWLFGRIMARENDPMNAFAFEALAPQPGDHVLEIGFGPGEGLARLARIVGDGYVAGLDHSEAMVRAAERRNRAAVVAGRVDPRQGCVSSIPFPDASFDKAVAVNTHQFWPDPPADLAEIARVLAPGGRLVVAIRVPSAGKKKRYDGIAYTQEEVAQLKLDLASAGFATDRCECRELAHVTAAVFVARRL